METKTLLVGLGGFMLGGLVVSLAATMQAPIDQPHGDGMTMTQMTDSLKGKTGDDFDRAFIASMIDHHQGAIDMARLAGENAKHDEIKRLSSEIMTAQDKEITQMKQWQKDWGYGDAPTSHDAGGH